MIQCSLPPQSFFFHVLHLDVNWLTVTLAILGKWGVSANYNFLYMIASEVYPTPLRSIGLASCSTMGRIGGVLSPFIAQMVDSDIIS